MVEEKLPRDASLGDVIRHLDRGDGVTEAFTSAVWRNIEEIKSQRKEDELRLRGLENVMVTRDDITTAVDRGEQRTAGKIDDLGGRLDAAMATLTLSMDQIPKQAQRIMALETTAKPSPNQGLSTTTWGTIIGGVIATLAACGAAIKSIMGGE